MSKSVVKVQKVASLAVSNTDIVTTIMHRRLQELESELKKLKEQLNQAASTIIEPYLNVDENQEIVAKKSIIEATYLLLNPEVKSCKVTFHPIDKERLIDDYLYNIGSKKSNVKLAPRLLVLINGEQLNVGRMKYSKEYAYDAFGTFLNVISDIGVALTFNIPVSQYIIDLKKEISSISNAIQNKDRMRDEIVARMTEEMIDQSDDLKKIVKRIGNKSM